jgi:(S)-3,5-dihydroxyphenylglycine transaminase
VTRPLTLAEYGHQAAEVVKADIWDFVAGGAGDERTLAANLEAFDRVRLRPRILAGVEQPETRTSILGRSWIAPVGVAPMAYHTLLHADGEVATALAAGAAGLPLVVSTFAGRTFEDIAAGAAAALWLQVYCFKDRAVTRDLILRAERAGFEALLLTVDAPRLGRRLRDERNDFRLPPGVGPANLDGWGCASPAEHSRMVFDAGLDWSVIDWLRSVTALPVLLKGVLTGADARQAVRLGVQGLVVSNHGGRQLDGVSATLESLPEVAAAVAGACPVLLDGGIRRGRDVLAALALGASAVLVGRPVLHGLAVAGQDGVARVLDLLIAELTEAMILTGTAAVADAGPELIGTGPVSRPVPASSPGPPRPVPERGAMSGLRKEELHPSLSDPMLDTMNFLNEITLRYPEAISFAPGRPHDGFFDTEQIFTHLRGFLAHLEERGYTPDQVKGAMFQYGPTSGQIREVIAESLRRDEGIDVPPKAIVVTVGCQEAMFLTLRALMADGADSLLVATPCYVGISGAARLLDIGIAAVNEGPDGFRCIDLERAIHAERARGRRPRAFYVVPDHSNPSGTTVPDAERRFLLELADREDIFIIEDSPYRTVSAGRQLPTLKSLDRHRRVIHLGSYSKTLFPGARVGFVVADQVVTDASGGTGLLAAELAKIKSMVTVNTSPLSQAVVAGMLMAAEGRMFERNAEVAAYYGEAMRTTLGQLDDSFPASERAALAVDWNRPTGGFFLALSTPFPADSAALARSAEHYGVIWTPMSYFYPQGGGDRSIRLSVSHLTADEIVEGVSRLARFIRAEAGALRSTRAGHRGKAE